MQPGRVVKRRYHLEAEVARGGMGAVFRARDPDGGLAAVKVLQHDAGRSSERFMREAQLLSQLDHPGIVRYLDTGITERGEPFFTMEWLEGVGESDALALAAALRGRGERAQLEALLQRARRAEYEPAARSLETALAGLG